MSPLSRAASLVRLVSKTVACLSFKNSEMASTIISKQKGSFARLLVSVWVILFICLKIYSSRGKQFPENMSLVFLHIPKCGGSSVRQMLLDDLTHLKSTLGMSQLKRCEENPENGQQREHPYWVNTFIGAAFSSQEFANCSYRIRSKVRFLTGHIAYGACSFLSEPCKYITVLREPRSRLISEVKWIQLQKPNFQKYSVSDFIELSVIPNSSTVHFCKLLDNHQIRLLSGDSFQSIFQHEPTFQTPCNQITSVHFELARQNLLGPQMLSVGLLSNLSAFRSEIRSKLGLEIRSKHDSIIRENANPIVVSENLSLEAQRIVEQFTRHDAELYRLWAIGGFKNI